MTAPMRGVRVRHNLTGDVFGQMADMLEPVLFQEMTKAAQETTAEARAYISMSGTGKNWDGAFPDLKQGGGRRSAPSRGRVNTGAMREAVDYQVTRGATVQARVGWIHRYEEYFTHQDKGFAAGGYRERVQDPASVVEGMHMLAHLRVYFRLRSEAALDRALKRVMNHGI